MTINSFPIKYSIIIGIHNFMNVIYVLLIGILQETITHQHISTVPPTEQVKFVITPPDDQSRVLETVTSSQQTSNDVVTNIDLETGNGVNVVPEGQEVEEKNETKEESEEGNEKKDEKLPENMEKSEEQKPEEIETQKVVEEEEEEVKQEVEVVNEKEKDIVKEPDIPEQKDSDPNSSSMENSSIPLEKEKSFDSSVGEVQPISNTPPSEEQTTIVVPKTSVENDESKLDRPSTPTEVKSKLTPSPEIMTSSPILEVKRFVHRNTCQTSY